MAYLGIFGQEFEKNVVRFKISTLKFVYLQKIPRKSKIFGLEFENKHPRICVNAKFREKAKMPKFGTKNALFGYFWPRILQN